MRFLIGCAHELRDIIRTCEEIGTDEFSATMFKNKQKEVTDRLYKNRWCNREDYFYFLSLDRLRDVGVVDFVREEKFTMSGTKYDRHNHIYNETAFEATRYWYKINVDNVDKLRALAEVVDNLAE